MSVADPEFPSPGAGTFDGALVAMVLVVVGVLVGVALWRLATSRGSAEEPAPAGTTSDPGEATEEPLLSRAERQRVAADRLRELQQQRDDGSLSESEYAERRRALLRDL